MNIVPLKPTIEATTNATENIQTNEFNHPYTPSVPDNIQTNEFKHLYTPSVFEDNTRYKSNDKVQKNLMVHPTIDSNESITHNIIPQTITKPLSHSRKKTNTQKKMYLPFYFPRQSSTFYQNQRPHPTIPPYSYKRMENNLN